MEAHSAYQPYDNGKVQRLMFTEGDSSVRSSKLDGWLISTQFFTLAPLQKKEFDEILSKVAKKLGKDLREVNFRDLSNGKRTFFEEYDRILSAKGHAQYEHIKNAADECEGGDIRRRLSDYERAWLHKSAKSKPSVNLVETNNTDDKPEVNALNGFRNQRKPDTRKPLTVRGCLDNPKFMVNAKTRKIFYVSETALPPITEDQLRNWKSSSNKAFVALTPRIGGNVHNKRNLRQRQAVEKTYRDKGRNVKVGHKQYRAFEINALDRSCPAFDMLAEEIALVDVDSGSDTEAVAEEAYFMEGDQEDIDDMIPGEPQSIKTNYNVFSISKTDERKLTDTMEKIAYVEFPVISVANEIKKYRVLFDSGASCNVCPESFVEILMSNWSCNVRTQDCQESEAKVANGNALKFVNYTAEFDLEFNDKFKLKFKDTKVHRAGGNTIILGRPGLALNEVEMRISRDGASKLNFTVRGRPLSKIWSCLNACPINELKEVRVCEEPVEIKRIERTPTMYEHLYDISVVKSMKPTSVYDPDGTRAWYRKIERIHRENREKNTVADVIIDPENTVLKGDNVTRQKLLNLLEKYSCVFEATIGHVVDSEFEVHAKIDAAKSDRSPKSAPMGYGKNLPESIQKGIEDTLDKEAAEGVLRFLPKGVTAKNSVSFFGVGKRDAETAKIEMSPTNVRIVVDCSKQINGATQHCAKQMDSIQRILQLAAPHTKHGFIAQVDISSMFHCFALAKELWPHFVVNHPKMGRCAIRGYQWVGFLAQRQRESLSRAYCTIICRIQAFTWTTCSSRQIRRSSC